MSAVGACGGEKGIGFPRDANGIGVPSIPHLLRVAKKMLRSG